ncbi:hypothetical protein SAMN02745857_03889 [Andreprevotia lacus DSM 23236]|jgi:hypothetical protein|uniref:Uncharacterized protein n=1 Tax=Andreprevotia lacus DSM 23236 TaxID=1121001 RepID=A0A1W1XZX9_9NEIS|nr:major capsid protein P2 [Andreprevotia lacus]SMC29520.1 hypothetical protein SAMN02745857_03889 [Andreprevotia lacus DSM 23236]
MSLHKKELPFFNVAAGSTATLQLPLGPTYEYILLQMAGTTFSKLHITDIRVKINGKTMHQCSGADLESMNAYTGLATSAAFLQLDFTELFARDQVGQSIGALGTAAGVSAVMIEVDIAGTAVAPSLTAYSVTSAPKQLGVVNKLIKYPVNIGGAGKWPVQLPYGPQGGSIIKRVYVKSANITGLEVKLNGVVIHDSVKASNEFAQTLNRKTPQGGWYVWDPIVDNNQTDMVNTTGATSFEFNGYFSASEAITVYVEYIDALGNL